MIEIESFEFEHYEQGYGTRGESHFALFFRFATSRGQAGGLRQGSGWCAAAKVS